MDNRLQEFFLPLPSYRVIARMPMHSHRLPFPGLFVHVYLGPMSLVLTSRVCMEYVHYYLHRLKPWASSVCFSLSTDWFWKITIPMGRVNISERPHERMPPTSQELLHEQEIRHSELGVHLSPQIALIQNRFQKGLKKLEGDTVWDDNCWIKQSITGKR